MKLGRVGHQQHLAPETRTVGTCLILILGGRFGYFLFFLLGEGEGGVRGAGREGGSVFIENPGGGGWGFQDGRGRGAGRCLWRVGEFGGGGLNIFSGAEMSTKDINPCVFLS